MAPHLTPDAPPMQQLALSAPVVHTPPSCSLQSLNPSKREEYSSEGSKLNRNLECPGPQTRPLDLASMAHHKACSQNATDAANTIFIYDMEVISICELSQLNLVRIQ